MTAPCKTHPVIDITDPKQPTCMMCGHIVAEEGSAP
jgi:hypothetical protein